MQLALPQQTSLPERRANVAGPPGVERRQFSDSRDCDRPEVRELAEAIDQYKLLHRRRFVTFDELYDVLVSLGYHK
jgi:hypothetical protein